MGFVEDIQAKQVLMTEKLTAIGTVTDAIDLKLDEVALRIQELINAGGATPEQLQAILTDMTSLASNAETLQTHLEAVGTEAAALVPTP